METTDMKVGLDAHQGVTGGLGCKSSMEVIPPIQQQAALVINKQFSRNMQPSAGAYTKSVSGVNGGEAADHKHFAIQNENNNPMLVTFFGSIEKMKKKSPHGGKISSTHKNFLSLQ